MTHSLIIALLGIISVCAVCITVILLFAAADLRKILRQANILLPHCDEAVREAKRTFEQARLLLARTNQTTREIQTVVQKSCVTASNLLERLSLFKAQARHIFDGRFTNGDTEKHRKHS